MGNNLIINRLKSSKVAVFLRKVSAFVCHICCHLSTLAQGLSISAEHWSVQLSARCLEMKVPPGLAPYLCLFMNGSIKYGYVTGSYC